MCVVNAVTGSSRTQCDDDMSMENGNGGGRANSERWTDISDVIGPGYSNCYMCFLMTA